MFRSHGIVLSAAILLIGIPVEVVARSKAPEPVIEPVVGKAAPELNWTNPAATNILLPIALPPSPPHAVKTSQPITPVVTWMSLNSWAAAHRLKAPKELADLPEKAFTLESPNGVMTLGIGSREVTWNGIEINLGFAPQIIDGEVCLYGADFQKNLEPLLCGVPYVLPQTNRTIVIDPGHGGSNPGTVCVLDGRLEKEFTLDLALRIKPLLETNGWTVFLTRTADVDVVNSNRVTFADAHHADLFVSLHFNATGDRDPYTSGIETYCVTPTGLPSTLTRDYPDPQFAVWPNNAFDTQNLLLAVRVHNAMIRTLGLEDRGVYRARFMTVLRGQSRPSILIEGGYLSNPRDAKLIENPDYRQKLAETIANALK